MAREIPKEITGWQKAWRKWSGIWNWTNTVMGVSAALLSTLVAANAKGRFLSDSAVIACSMAAAALAFLVTTLNADAKGKGFALAAREVEAATARYGFDPTLPDSFLADAVVRGIAILNAFESKKPIS